MSNLTDINIEVSYAPGVISNNFEVVKNVLTEKMEEYKSFGVTKENKKESKDLVATFRKGIKTIGDKKSSIRKECLKPYDAFCIVADELVAIIQEPISLIDNQVKELEEHERLAKKSEINEVLQSVMGDLLEDISKDLIYNEKWENATTSMKSIKEDIQAKTSEIRQAISTIKMMQSDKMQVALDGYYNDLNLAKAMTTITTYDNQKREFERQAEERRAREREQELEREKERVRREALAEIQRERQIEEEARAKALLEVEEQRQAEVQAMAVQRQVSAATTGTYRITATHEEMEQIEMYLNSLAIEFERIG